MGGKKKKKEKIEKQRRPGTKEGKGPEKGTIIAVMNRARLGWGVSKKRGTKRAKGASDQPKKGGIKRERIVGKKRMLNITIREESRSRVRGEERML